MFSRGNVIECCWGPHIGQRTAKERDYYNRLLQTSRVKCGNGEIRSLVASKWKRWNYKWDFLQNVMEKHRIATLSQFKELAATMFSLTTSYSLLVMTYDRIYAVRDPYGNRPLCAGVMYSPLYSPPNNGWILFMSTKQSSFLLCPRVAWYLYPLKR